MIPVYILSSHYDPISWDNWEPAPNNIWKRTFDLNEAKIIFSIDNLNFNWELNQKKILLLAEPIGIIPENYHIFNDENILMLNNIDIVGTHHLRFLNKKNIIGINPPVGTSIHNKLIYPKNKLCSIVTSSKYWAQGHRKRLEILNNLEYTTLDKYGRDINPITDKTDGLKDYAFSFAIENSSERGYYTEKLLDCFLTGTIPIYWGDPGIDTIFDKNGIVFYNESFNYNDLSFELYNSKLNSIKVNFEIAKKLLDTNNMDYCTTFLIQQAIK